MSSLSYPQAQLSQLPVTSDNKFEFSLKNPAMRAETEGGYVITRTRFKRAPRKMFTLNYVLLNSTDQFTLETFYKDMQGGSDTFFWQNPNDGITYTVRFVEDLRFTLRQMGTRKEYECQIKLEEV